MAMRCSSAPPASSASEHPIRPYAPYAELVHCSNSPTLSGAQASSTQANSSRSDARHYEVYRSEAIRDKWAEREGTRLVTEEDCRLAMILVALLGGGDYVQEGLKGFGGLILPEVKAPL